MYFLQTFSEIRRCSQNENGCVIYIPSIDLLWPLLGESGANLIMHLWQELSVSGNCLFLGTCNCTYNDLPEQVFVSLVVQFAIFTNSLLTSFIIFLQLRSIFPVYKNCIFNVKEASSTEISDFLKPLFLSKPLEHPDVRVDEHLPELPKGKYIQC